MASYIAPYIPECVHTFTALFPLVEFEGEGCSTQPTRPVLRTADALDPFSRYILTLARFLDVEIVPSPSGDASDTSLPYLLLPSGDVTASASLAPTILKLSGAKLAYGDETKAFIQAYEALVRSTLLPALLSHVYLQGPAPGPPAPAKPLLRSLLDRLSASHKQQTTIDQILKLRGQSPDALIDTESIYRDSLDALDDLEVALTTKSTPWFGDQTPSTLDAWVYTLLTLITETHCDKLEKRLATLPMLSQWLKDHS